MCSTLSFSGPKSTATKTATTAVSAITEEIFDDHATPITEKDKENILMQQQETQLQTQTVGESLPPTEIATATPLTTTQMARESTEKTVAEKNPVTDNQQKKDEASTKKGPNTVEILSNELIDLNNKSNTNAITEILQTKEVSPKKTSTRFTPLVIKETEENLHYINKIKLIFLHFSHLLPIVNLLIIAAAPL